MQSDKLFDRKAYLKVEANAGRVHPLYAFFSRMKESRHQNVDEGTNLRRRTPQTRHEAGAAESFLSIVLSDCAYAADFVL